VAEAFVTCCGRAPCPAPARFPRRALCAARHRTDLSQACRGACHPADLSDPGIDDPQGGITPARRTPPGSGQGPPSPATAECRAGRSAGRRRRHPCPGEPGRADNLPAKARGPLPRAPRV